MSTATATRTAVRVVDAVKVYGSGDTAVPALDGVTVGFPAGRFTAIMGPSGSGKSTLMHCAAGLDTLTSGSARLGDTELTGLDDRRLTLLRRERIGFVLQSFNLVPTLTVAENITLPLDLAGRAGEREWIDALVDVVGLRDRLHHRPAELSGGQQVGVPPGRSGTGGVLPSRGLRPGGRTSSSPTSRPATSTPAPARRSSACWAARCARWTAPSSWSPTTRWPPPTPTRCSSSPTGAWSTAWRTPPPRRSWTG
ncbi:hypothetical protein GCM10010389_49580 [Streptomyces echinoruber]|uniref:ABC transporter domain-containing protein n=1 Tax=Streptomyces echinoruber TaxID=68898 RepID=A0A918RPY5_9ACTN|nr:hypothetical protein GCM10010389_49580 [Streptomyces echinoruber]